LSKDKIMAKLQIHNIDNCVAWLWPDDHTVSLDADGSLVTAEGQPPMSHDMTSENSTLYEGVTDVPDDWDYDKYLYDGTTWTLNPNYVVYEEEEGGDSKGSYRGNSPE
jgi:hypothetical protein